MAIKIIIDLVLCAIIAAGIVLGLKYGFVKMAARPVKAVASFILAFSLASTVGATVIMPMIDAPITNYLKEFLYANCSGLTADNINEELPTLLKIAAAIFNIDINQATSNAGADILDAIINNLVSPVISLISTIIAFFALYILAKIAFAIVFMMINFLFKSGVFGLLNKALGVVFAGTLSIIITWGVAVLLEIVFHLPTFEGNELFYNFEGGFFYKFFNTYNPIELLLSF